jgi:hypothetical protein
MLEDDISQQILNGEITVQLPEIIHIFTKRDKMGYEGYKR